MTDLDSIANHNCNDKHIKRYRFIQNADDYLFRSESSQKSTELDLRRQSVCYTQLMGSQTCTLVVLVGLPARGKTFIASRLTRYLNWIGLETRIFNVGTYRRQMSTDEDQTAEFFDPSNEQNNEKRDRFCEEAMKDLSRWIDELPGRIAVLDATNTTRKRRQRVLDTAKDKIKNDCNVFFIESICDDPDTIEKTVNECKVHGPDFANKTDKEAAAQDFLNRIEMYKKVYETIDDKFDECLSYIKIINVGQRFLVNRVKDHIQSKIVYFLMNIKVGRGRQIYFTRHGESEFNVLGKIGGDSSLSENGQEYARQLGAFVHENLIEIDDGQGDKKSGLKIWVSELKRTQQTAGCINHEIESWKILNEINAGVCEGMTYKEIGAAYPKIMKERDQDKYNYRYPMGESYYDLVQRLEPVIMELEKRDNVQNV